MSILGNFVNRSEDPTVSYTPLINQKGQMVYDLNAATGEKKLFMISQLAHFYCLGYINEDEYQKLLNSGRIRIKVDQDANGIGVPEELLDVPTRQALRRLVDDEMQTVFPEVDIDVPKNELLAMHWWAGTFRWERKCSGFKAVDFEIFNDTKDNTVMERYIRADDELRARFNIKNYKDDVERLRKGGAKKQTAKKGTNQQNKETAAEKALRENCEKTAKEAGDDGTRAIIDQKMNEMAQIMKEIVQYGKILNNNDSANVAGTAETVLNRLAPIVYQFPEERRSLMEAVHQIDAEHEALTTKKAEEAARNARKERDAKDRAQKNAKPANNGKPTNSTKPTNKTVEPQVASGPTQRCNVDLYDYVVKFEKLDNLSVKQMKSGLAILNELAQKGRFCDFDELAKRFKTIGIDLTPGKSGSQK